MRRFEHKVALVTGAASGIGEATAVRLAAEGARVVCADVDESAVSGVAASIGDAGGEARAVRCDVTREADAEAAVKLALDAFGQLDVLCNVAGILRFDHTHELSLDDWRRILDVNLTGTFLLCRAALPELLRTGGNVVNMASCAAIKGQPWSAAYNASKGGVVALTLGLAVEYGKQGLRVNAVSPASIDTPIQQAFHLPEGANPKLLQRIMPLNGFAKPEACAASIAYLASDDASHVNGANLVVDGGMSA
jgi:meso-butanediol dehydrogenase/(S,S)-butanediol dehydrogenase/diacetyl reductase